MYPRRTKKSLPAALLACLLVAVAGFALCLTTNERPAAAAASGSRPASPTAQAASPSPTPRHVNGKIAFASGDSSNNYDIWLVNPDGSKFTNLTPNTPQSAERSPAWSPDGAQIVFSRRDLVTGTVELVLMNADGSNRIKLPIAAASSPAWSPDGTKIAYSARRNNVTDIYVANTDGSGELNLTNSPASDASPTWSPDGAQIAYVSGDRPSAAGLALYVMNADGSNQRKILDESVVRGISSPKWSPDGAQIMFQGGLFENPPPHRAYLVAPDGSNFTHIQDNVPHYDPAWSPDGKQIVYRTHDEPGAEIGVRGLEGLNHLTQFSFNSGSIDREFAWQPLTGSENKIVFTSERDGNPEIYVMESDGSNQINVTNNPAKDVTPVWSPDGRRIAFTSDRNGRSNIYVMDADGGNVRAVTNFDNTIGDYRVYDPAWSPDGTKLVYVGSPMGETSALVVVNSDGSGESRPILEGSTEVADPAWSPDGTRIAYVGREPFFNPEDGVRYYIFVINADGSGKTRVSDLPLPFTSMTYPPTASGPAWKRDGSAIAFAGNQSPGGGTVVPQLILVAPNGGIPIFTTSNPFVNTLPGWTNDNRIIFTLGRDSQREIYVTLVASTLPESVAFTRLTENDSADYDPDWQPDPPPPQRIPTTFQWRSNSFRVRENGQGGDPLVLTRLGDLSQPSTVDFQTSELTCIGTHPSCALIASERSDYIRTTGTLHFAPGEASKTIHVPLVDDTFVEGDQNFLLEITNVTGATFSAFQPTFVTITDDDTAADGARPNPIDEPNFFVRMHYLDFLGREPEPAGQQAWVNVWNRCPDINNDESCDRVTISSAFFRSQEFQMRGFFVYRFYRVSFNRRPTYAEFVRDTARITGQTLAEIDASKDAFALEWTRRADFRAAYFAVGVPINEYVARLEANTGVTLTGDVTRQTLEADLLANRRTHSQVLRAIVEHPEVEAADYNGAFVTMQYFGYLKRDPEEEGFQNWMRVINRGDGYRVMVHGFVNSVEYRARFGQL